MKWEEETDLFVPNWIFKNEFHQPVNSIGVSIFRGGCDSRTPVIDALNSNVTEGRAKERAQKLPHAFSFGEWPMFRTSYQACNDFGGAALGRFVWIAH